jgi:UDP-2,3-diacylglucosamine pyrophosphatase LpxH
VPVGRTWFQRKKILIFMIGAEEKQATALFVLGNIFEACHLLVS